MDLFEIKDVTALLLLSKFCIITLDMWAVDWICINTEYSKNKLALVSR